MYCRHWWNATYCVRYGGNPEKTYMCFGIIWQPLRAKGYQSLFHTLEILGGTGLSYSLACSSGYFFMLMPLFLIHTVISLFSCKLLEGRGLPSAPHNVSIVHDFVQWFIGLRILFPVRSDTVRSIWAFVGFKTGIISIFGKCEIIVTHVLWKYILSYILLTGKIHTIPQQSNRSFNSHGLNGNKVSSN